jgi:uncharacterized protein
MGPAEAIAIFAGGLGAGVVNAAVGSGTLITFPVLLAFGYTPVTANVSNTIGLVPGSLSGALAYRSQLRDDLPLLLRFAAPSIVGGGAGAALLLTLPPHAFKAVVPFFIAIALGLVIVGPRLTRAAFGRPRGRRHTVALLLALLLSGTYGGYFGAAQGIIVLATLGLFLGAEPQQVNGLKNVLVMLVNLVAGIAFVAAAHVAWLPALLIAGGSVIGGSAGAGIAKRLPASLFRLAIVCVAIVAIVRLVG